MIPVPFFDSHCDTLSCCAHLGWDMAESEGHVDIRRGMRFEHYAQVFAIYRDPAKIPRGGAFDEFSHQVETFRMQMIKHKNFIMHCKTEKDLEKAQDSNRIAALLSVEGADLLDCNPKQLDIASDIGVKMINLTWNRANDLSGTNVDDPARGLSTKGREFVKRMQELDILVDVSHLSDQGARDAIIMTEKPIIASHSNARALCDHTRNITDNMFREIRNTKGYVGINLYSDFIGRDNSINAIFAHLEHFLSMDGVKNVGFGADWDGCRKMAGRIHGIQDMQLIYDEMVRRRYSDELIYDIFYGNLKRVLFESKQDKGENEDVLFEYQG